MDKTPIPAEIKLRKSARELLVRFDEGNSVAVPVEELQGLSAAGEGGRRGGGGDRLVAGEGNVYITRIQQVGDYAVRLLVSDGHVSGLYSRSVLHDLGRTQPANWARYLARLQAAGLAR